MNLLEQFALSGTRVVKLLAELKHNVTPDDQVQAKVELKLTPAELPEEAGSHFQVGASLVCDGFVTIDESTKPAFRIECTINAVYRQISGPTVSFDSFKSAHHSLTRQLYPLIHQQIMPTFHLLGLHHVHLPQDIVQTQRESAPAKESVH